VLAGRLVGTAPYNWLGSRGSLQDNMKETMSRLGGSGLPKKDLADLELFITRYLDAGPEHGPERLSALQAHGKELFDSDEVGCAHCHAPGSLYTDGKNHDIGTTTREEIARLLAERGQPQPRSSGVDVLAALRMAVNGISTTQLLRAIGGRPLDITPGTDQVVASVGQQVILGRPAPMLTNARFGGDVGVVFGGEGLRAISTPPPIRLAKKTKRGEKPMPPPTRLAYNTPSLLGVSATAPYFHDGSARTLREVLTTGNAGDRMGRTSQLKPKDIDALVAYLETL
jgi:mono/diheme cytochrome c family protein